MSSPIPRSAFKSRPKAAVTLGRSTAAKTSSRPGRTIPSLTGRARSSTCAMRTTGDAVGADRPADPRRGCALYRPARPGLQPLRAQRARYCARSPPIRTAQRSHQDLTADDSQHVGAAPAAFGHGLCGVGAWPVPQRVSALGRDGTRSRDRRDARAQPLEQDFRFPGRLCGPRLGGRTPGQATGGNSWGVMARSTIRPGLRREPRFPSGSARASIHAARFKPRSSSSLGKRWKSSSSSARRRQRPLRNL